jgi:hypothetical protein
VVLVIAAVLILLSPFIPAAKFVWAGALGLVARAVYADIRIYEAIRKDDDKLIESDSLVLAAALLLTSQQKPLQALYEAVKAPCWAAVACLREHCAVLASHPTLGMQPLSKFEAAMLEAVLQLPQPADDVREQRAAPLHAQPGHAVPLVEAAAQQPHKPAMQQAQSIVAVLEEAMELAQQQLAALQAEAQEGQEDTEQQQLLGVLEELCGDLQAQLQQAWAPAAGAPAAAAAESGRTPEEAAPSGSVVINFSPDRKEQGAFPLLLLSCACTGAGKCRRVP